MGLKMKKSVFVLILSFLLTFCTKNNTEKMNKIFKDYEGENPGAAVMVIRNTEIIFEKGYGIANFEDKTPVSAATNFRLASVTKQFTAMSVLQLIDEGKLNFDTNLKEIFPDFPDYGKQITIKNLLQHTSGLIDYEDLIPDSATVQVKDKDVLEMMMQTDSTYFEPGTEHRYSNTGYALLAMIIEKVSGEPFREYLKENIFEPLGMKNTLAYERGINDVPERAFGYTITDTGIVFTDQSITSAVLGDGGIYSSLNDLYKWDQALYSDKVIRQNYLDESFTHGMTTDSKEFNYGYGWRLENFKDMEVKYHTGSTRGFRNIIYRIPSKEFTVIILTNRDQGSEFSTLDLAHEVVDLYFNE